MRDRNYRLFALSVLSVSLWLTVISAASGQDKPPVKIGVLGLDNYQAVAYAQLFNDPKAAGDLAGAIGLAMRSALG